MAWWSKVDGKIEKHDGRQPKLNAGIRLNFAVSMGGAKVEDCGLYTRSGKASRGAQSATSDGSKGADEAARRADQVDHGEEEALAMCDEPEAICNVTRRASKAHRCCECGHTIPAGDRYQYTSGVWDHRGDSFKTCVSCAALRGALYDALDTGTADCGPPFGGLVQYMQENEIEPRIDDPALLGWAFGLMCAALICHADDHEERGRIRRSKVTVAA